MTNDKKFNLYEILGVSKDTLMDDIKKAFKTRSKELHPDKGGNPEDFANLKKAFDILMDPAKRNLYDEYGIDDSLDIEIEAKLVAVQIVVSALEGLSDSCDVDKEISAIFQRCLNGLSDQEAAAKNARDKLQRRLDSIQRKPVNDFLTNEILRVIETHNKSMKQTQLNYRIHDTAFRLVQEYQFDITRIPFMGESNSMRVRRMNHAEAGAAARAQQELYKSLGLWIPL
jgi:curved DNA-binding protein CbpA